MGKAERRLNKLAYGRLKPIGRQNTRTGKLIDTGAQVGAKIMQISTARPLAFGIKKGRGR